MLNYLNLNFLCNNFNISEYFFALIFFSISHFQRNISSMMSAFLRLVEKKYIEIPRDQIVNVCKKFQHSLCR
jgi:hypothetical protein